MIRPRLPAAAIALGLAGSSGLAATIDQATPSAPVTCRDRFMLDRRDNPQNAIKNLNQCNAIQNVSVNMEDFTFWYVTLPVKSHAREDFRFDKAWRNNLAILTGSFVNLRPEKANAILDNSIVEALRRGKRDDLVANWLNSHNPAVLAAAMPGHGEPEPVAAAAAAPIRPAAATPAVTAAVPAAPGNLTAGRGAVRTQRFTRRSPRRYARAAPYFLDSGGARPASDEQLNSAQLGPQWYGAAAAYPPIYYPPMAPPVASTVAPSQPYVAASPAPAYPVVPIQPSAYPAPVTPRQPFAPVSAPAPVVGAAPAPPVVGAAPAPPAAVAAPTAIAPSVPLPAVARPPVVAPPAAIALPAAIAPAASPAVARPVATAVAMPPAPPGQSTAAGGVGQPPYRTIPQQVERNFSTIGQLIEENIRTFQQTFFFRPGS